MRGWWLVSFLVLWALVGALAVLCVALARQIGVLHLRIAPTGALDTGEGPPLGEPAPPVAAVPRGRETLVVFGSDSCRMCHDLLPSVSALARSEPGLAVVVASPSASFAAEVRPPAIGRADVAAMAAWRVRGTPFAVYLDRDGVVGAKGIVNTLEHLESLVAQGRLPA